MASSQGNLIFEIFGKSERTFMEKLKKHYPYYFALYTDGVVIRTPQNEEFYPVANVLDFCCVYSTASEYENDNNYVYMSYYNKDGVEKTYSLNTGVYTDLDTKILEVLQKGWGNIKLVDDPTLRWIIAIPSIMKLDSEMNGLVYGSQFRNERMKKMGLNMLGGGWSVHSKDNLILAFRSLYDEYESLTRIDDKHYRAACAWDLLRLVHISSYGYLCDYITYEESLDWSLKSAQKIQQIFESWDDFMEYYLLGCSDWEGVPLNDPSGLANHRLKIYEEAKLSKFSPWSVDWNTTLRKSWR